VVRRHQEAAPASYHRPWPRHPAADHLARRGPAGPLLRATAAPPSSTGTGPSWSGTRPSSRPPRRPVGWPRLHDRVGCVPAPVAAGGPAAVKAAPWPVGLWASAAGPYPAGAWFRSHHLVTLAMAVDAAGSAPSARHRLRTRPDQAYSRDAFKQQGRGWPARGQDDGDRGCPLRTGIDRPMWHERGRCCSCCVGSDSHHENLPSSPRCDRTIRLR
jgi:hypothetical protein